MDNNKIIVHLNKEDVQEARDLALAIAAKKMWQDNYRSDAKCLTVRFLRGVLGEMACEKYFGITFCERVADNKRHDHPDIQKSNIGVKTGRTGIFPLVEKVQTYDQIICICDAELHEAEEVDVEIVGLATPEIIMSSLDDSKIKDPAVKAKGKKSAFVGLDKLLPITPELFNKIKEDYK